MEAQKYFEKLVGEANVFIKKSEELRSEFPEFFNNFPKENILTLDDDKMKSFFQTSQIINDTQVIFIKVASLLHFCNKIGVELDVACLNDVKGLSDFITLYDPFSTDYVFTTQGNFELKNIKENDEKFKHFKKNIKNIIENNLINES